MWAKHYVILVKSDCCVSAGVTVVNKEPTQQVLPNTGIYTLHTGLIPAIVFAVVIIAVVCCCYCCFCCYYCSCLLLLLLFLLLLLQLFFVAVFVVIIVVAAVIIAIFDYCCFCCTCCYFCCYCCSYCCCCCCCYCYCSHQDYHRASISEIGCLLLVNHLNQNLSGQSNQWANQRVIWQQN